MFNHTLIHVLFDHRTQAPCCFACCSSFAFHSSSSAAFHFSAFHSLTLLRYSDHCQKREEEDEALSTPHNEAAAASR